MKLKNFWTTLWDEINILRVGWQQVFPKSRLPPKCILNGLRFRINGWIHSYSDEIYPIIIYSGRWLRYLISKGKCRDWKIGMRLKILKLPLLLFSTFLTQLWDLKILNAPFFYVSCDEGEFWRQHMLASLLCLASLSAIMSPTKYKYLFKLFNAHLIHTH